MNYSNVILDQKFTNNQFQNDESKQRLIQILTDEGNDPISNNLVNKLSTANSNYQHEIWFWSYSMKHPASFDNSDFYFSNYRMIVSFRNNQQLHFITSVFLFDIQKIYFDQNMMMIKTKRDQLQVDYQDNDEKKYLKDSADILRIACNQAKHANGDYSSDLKIQNHKILNANQNQNIDSKTDQKAKASTHTAIQTHGNQNDSSKYKNKMPIASGGDIPNGFEFVENYYTASSDPIMISTTVSYKKAMKVILENIQHEIKATNSSAGFNFKIDYDVDLVAHMLNIFAYVDICKKL